jgi:hypothetical protein
MALKRLSLIQGNSKTYTLALTGSDGTTPFCLKNWVVFFTLKTNPEISDSQASLQKIVTTFSDTTSGTSGIAEVELLPADTKDLEIGEYDFDFRVLTAASKSYTIMKGKLNLEYNVTDSLGTAGTAA